MAPATTLASNGTGWWHRTCGPRLSVALFAGALAAAGCTKTETPRATTDSMAATGAGASSDDLSPQSLADGQQVFRFETLGDEQCSTDTLHLNDVVEKAVDPTTELKVGLKVD